MSNTELLSLIDTQIDLLTELGRELRFQALSGDEALGWCPEHAFIVATGVRLYTTGLPQFSCGCPYTKARVVTYEEAIKIVKGIKHAQSGGMARFKRDGIHVNVVRYEGTVEDFESYCRRIAEVFQMQEVKGHR